MDSSSRRVFLASSTVLGAAALLPACKEPACKEKEDSKKNAAEEVTSAEDLMREHGILRRALVVYRETAARLRAAPESVPPDALQKTATLFRAFGEDYHEKKLEEAFIFPAVKRAGGAPAAYPDVLVAQHDRGREITAYILAATKGAKIGAGAQALAGVLDAFARMYDSHMALEDTIVFPAWKKTMTLGQYDELGERFEEIEHQTFGKDGFDDAAATIAAVEAALGLGDLARLTAPPPP